MSHIAALAALQALGLGCEVEQIHTALGKTTDALSVSWATEFRCDGQEVQYGNGLAKTAAADTREFTQDEFRRWYTHVAVMTGLPTNASVEYKAGSSKHSYSDVHKITNRRARPAGEPYRHIILGDMGSNCAFSLCTACLAWWNICDKAMCKKNTTVGLVSETEVADMFLHVGDFAYNLDTLDGLKGDEFFKNIEQIAAENVYMVSHGNHEDSKKGLAHYIESFRGMPSNAVPSTFKSANGETTNSLYFSWDYGLVHYVSISTELWFGVGGGGVNTTSLMTWLKKDLAAANKNRQHVPWIIVQGHRSMYCTCDGDCDGDAKKLRAALEQTLFEHGVDLFVNGHEHNYERTYPVFKSKSDRSNVNPKATIYVVSGAAGSQEMHEPFTKPQPEWSAFRSNSFSYSRVLVHNYTHLHWQQVQTDPTLFPLADYGRVIDDWWIVTDKHGSFNATTAPKKLAKEPCHDSLCESHDHWEPLMNLPGQAGEKSVDKVIRFRKEHGEEAWRGKLRGLLSHVHDRTRDTVQWENVRGDGNSDSAWLDDKLPQWKGGNSA